ncbi:polymorphic toxin-type HINT domain-containing protein [Cellulomonas telluris]|uniref:polymorphic toxin-type HINT domain-containing protein n=1 Tax=Cellulomonas telluris TaxID=2306636 RepID=UPI001FEA2E98|nr:polymorphic toxin-type HINT domain-containing protein [Cellulomonas telluris]
MSGRPRSRALTSLVGRVVVLAVAVTGVVWGPPTVASAADAPPPVARDGAAPVERPLPRNAVRTGDPDDVPVEPPAVPVADEAPVAAPMLPGLARPGLALGAAAGLGAATSPAADPAALAADAARDLVVRPGYLLGDTSLVVYFDADVADGDPTSWATWRATVTDAESGAQQVSADLGRTDLSRCGAPREFCRSFGAADGWTLDPARRYTVTISLVAEDGTTADSVPSAPAHPRTTVTPPELPAAQAAGCACSTVLGRTVDGQELRGALVNTGTGAFNRTERDLTMTSFGIPFEAVRFYSSANTGTGMFGAGWTWTYDARVIAPEAGADAIRVRAEDGAEAVYRRAADGSWTRPPGVRAVLTDRPGGGWALTPPDQRRLEFDAQGRLLSVKDARGHGLTLTYASNGLLSQLTDAAGRVVRVEHRQDVRAISKLTLPDGRSVQFDYEAGRLAKVQDARSYTWQYHYDAQGRLDHVTDARGKRDVTNTYGADGRVAQQADATGAVTTFAWDAEKEVATTTDADGVVSRDGYRENVLLWSRNGNGDTVTYRYDERLNESLVVDPEGNQSGALHDANGNPVERHAPAPFDYVERNAFDAGNNLTSHTDGRGNTWSYAYDQHNEMTSQKDPEQTDGYRYSYDARGLLATRTDPRGKVTRYEYDAAGNRTAEVTPTGRRTEFTYDGTGRLVSVVDPRGTVAGANKDQYRTRYAYDAQDRLVERRDPGKNEPVRTTYDELGNVVVVTDQIANSSRYTYDDTSRLVTLKDPVGNVTEYTYTKAGRTASVTDGEGNRTTWTYDAQGRVATERLPLGNAARRSGESDADLEKRRAAYTTTFRYDFRGNLVRAERPDAQGRLVQVDSTFDELGRPVQQVDELGATTGMSYDNAGNVTGMTDENGDALGLTYDRANRRTGGTGVDSPAQIEYDQLGNPTRQVTAAGGVITWQYDDDGRPVAITEPRGHLPGADPAAFTTRYAYDPAGNPTEVRDPLGNVTRSAYDPVGRLASTTDAAGSVVRYAYDLADRLVSVQGPDATSDQQALRYTYDANGQVTGRRDPRGHETKLEYDRAGRTVASTDPLGRRREYVYDANSNLVELVTARVVEGDPRIDPNREVRTVRMAYDTLDRPVSRQLGTRGELFTFGYDAKNRLVSMADPRGVREHAYDATGRLSKVTRTDTAGNVQAFSYGYDAQDNLTSRTYPDGTTVSATYDVADRLTSLTAEGADRSAATYRFGWDVADQLTSITFPEATGLTEGRTYDAAGRLTRVATTRAGGEVVSAHDVVRDAVGNPTRITATRTAGGPQVVEATSYAYDKAHRLTSACYGAASCAPGAPAAQRFDYGYDLVGNRTSQKVTTATGTATTAATFDAGDQLTRETTTVAGQLPDLPDVQAGTREYAYDAEGNQTKAGDEAYTYNLDRTLATATVDGEQTRYAYDAAGLRLSSATTAAEGALESTAWTWDVNGPLPTIAGETRTGPAGTETTSFLYAPDGSPLGLAEGGDDYSSYVRDWLGSTSAVVSPTGDAQWAYDYDPFGGVRGTDLVSGGKRLADDAPVNPLQFTGGYRDETQSDRYQLRARNYDTSSGRFDSVDPVAGSGQATGISPYAYASNRPTALTDPSGMRPDDGAASGATLPTADDPFASQREAAKKAVAEAEKFVAQIGDEIIGLVMDLIGYTDAKNCITKGDVGACISTALNAVPWGKMFKAAKVAIKAVGVGKRLVEGYSRLKTARRALSEIPKASPAKVVPDTAAVQKANTAVSQARNAATESRQVAARTSKEVDSAKRANQQARKQAENQKKECNSFTPATRVVLADGTSKAISDVRVGDTVLAVAADGTTAHRQVVATITGHGAKDLVDLTLVGSGGGGPPGDTTITATDGHLFLTADGDWVPAGDLKTGDQLVDPDGTPVTLAATTHRSQTATVHNLTVDTDHTYTVTTTDGTDVVTHNDDIRDSFDDAQDINSCPRRGPEPAAGGPRAVPDPDPQYTASGARDRSSAVYVNVRRADGSVETVGSRPGGVHAEDAADALEPGGQLSRPFGWRRDPASGDITWQHIPVCIKCQPKYPPTRFPQGTVGDPGGAWGR